MKRAKIIVGLGLGDEGKGITTDFLSRKTGQAIVVRYSGGPQAGHTVVNGEFKHTFSNFGSGTARGLPTYWSEYCTFYPPNALNEYDILIDKGIQPSLYVNPLAKLTTYWDVAWGRLRERIYNHGSCGIGVGATMMRHEQTPHKLFVIDLKHGLILHSKLYEIGRYYEAKLKELKLDETMEEYYHLQVSAEMRRFFNSLMSDFIRHTLHRKLLPNDFLQTYPNLIFEGSQGVLLDMDHGVYPNVTYANTTSKNAIQIIKSLKRRCETEIVYVTRCYLTRHGNGWTPLIIGGVDLINNEDECNKQNEWQGSFNVYELDYGLLRYALDVDEAYSYGIPKNLVVTCLDQRPYYKFKYSMLGREFTSIYNSHSQDSADFEQVKEMAQV